MQLDCQKAIDLGLAEPEAVCIARELPLSIAEGWKKYLAHAGRSPVLNGVAPSSLRRYENVRDRHEKYCEAQGVRTWEEFDKQKFEAFADWMFDKFAYQTCYVDLTQIKSVVKWLIEEESVPAGCRIGYRLRKIDESDTYCYRRNEVRRMIEVCGANSELKWLQHIIIVLSHLGLRFGESVDLRWADIDFDAGIVRVAEERFSRKKAKAGITRSTKGRRSRIIPLHPFLKDALLRIPRLDDGRVLHSVRGHRLRENNALKTYKSRVLRPLAEEFPTPSSEIGFCDGTFHSYRHFFASQCLIAGASEGEVREWLGHRDSKIVERYRHLRSEDALHRMNQIDFLCRDNRQVDPGKNA